MKFLRFFSIVALLSGAFGSFCQEQNHEFTLEDIYINRLYSAEYPDEIRSMNDGDYYSIIENDSLNVYKYKNGDYEKTIIHPAQLITKTGIMLELSDYIFNDDETLLLIPTQTEAIYRHSTKSVYYVFDLETKKLNPLIDDSTKVQLADFSPAGDKIAFVQNNNLFIKNLASETLTQITNDGKHNHIINGTTDWVYEEEFGFDKGFYWSPDGKRIAYYKFDESNVKQYALTYFEEDVYPRLYRYKYPKPGEKNSEISLHLYELESKENIQIDISLKEEFYIPRIKWTKDPEVLAIQKLNRLQNDLEILLVNALDKSINTIYHEKNPYYIEITDSWTFLPGNESFIITSEKSGYNHIYLYGIDGSLIRQLTKGFWDVSDLIGFDPNNELVYYISSETSPLNRDIFSVRLNGYKTRISQKEGYNIAEFSSNYKYYVNTWSDANTPPVISINKSNGKELRILEDNAELNKRLQDHNYSPKEFFKINTSEGVELNAWKINPPDFDKKKEYPVLFYVYGGPGSQTVINAWNRRNPWYELLAQHGLIIISVDNRGTGSRGQEFRKITYRQLGKLEIIDQIEAAKYLGSLSYIDKNRIGMFGWSYGGFMSTLAVTIGADYFSTGIAVAPVTNWRYYDNIYTERYMRTPQENPEGYDQNSPINHVEKLKGDYLLIHGSADDNVHYQNSMELIKVLVENKKQFELMIYPNKNHFLLGTNTTYHLYSKMTDFILKNLVEKK